MCKKEIKTGSKERKTGLIYVKNRRRDSCTGCAGSAAYPASDKKKKDKRRKISSDEKDEGKFIKRSIIESFRGKDRKRFGRAISSL